MEYDYTKAECPHCGKKILVERTLIGISHTAGIYATCLDCLMKKGIDAKFREAHPDFAEDIEDWYNSSEQSITEEKI